MKNTKIISLILFLSLSSCSKKEKIDSKIYNCSNYINPSNIESFFVENSYSGYNTLSLNEPKDKVNGYVKSIEEKVYETSIKFGEVVEHNIKINDYEFDDKNNLVKINYRKSEDNFKNNLVNIKYIYSQDGLKTYKKENFGKIYNIQFILETKYFYNKNNQLIKQIDINSDDSTVVKFHYDKKNTFFQSESYDATGKPNGNIFFKYDSINNTFTAENIEVKWELDNKCKLKKVTRVSLQGGSDEKGFTKQFDKIEVNGNGDIISKESFIIEHFKNESLIYNDDINLLNLRKDWESKSFKYKYDSKKNWIEKKDDNLIYRRKIIYK